MISPADLLLNYLAMLINRIDTDEGRRWERIEELEAQGHRIVDGGQDGEPDENGHSPFTTRDWRTGEILIAGRGTTEDHDRLLDEKDPDDRWYHIDHLDEILYGDEQTPLPPTPAGLPGHKIAEVLSEFVGENEDLVRDLVQAHIAYATGRQVTP